MTIYTTDLHAYTQFHIVDSPRLGTWSVVVLCRVNYWLAKHSTEIVSVINIFNILDLYGAV